LISNGGVRDAVYEKLQQTFSPDEIVALTLAIVAINGWNRLAISMRAPVGAYVSPRRPTSNRPPSASRLGSTGTYAKQEGAPCR
jgi:hypothetical protein